MSNKRKGARQLMRYRRYMRKKYVGYRGRHSRWTDEGHEQLLMEAWLPDDPNNF